ncbi:hypothetical protein XENOCAPTIV_025586 [Xenoophorus captivus]|uniref:Uncharacterized protein n=1 Tax=Xenoophorus captivus TaxID=1517983 RepID=A0ABV0S176_9TELE
MSLNIAEGEDVCNYFVYRPDRQLQDIVYKMVPFLEELEREQMCTFYKERRLPLPKPVPVSIQSPVVLKRQRKDNFPRAVFTIPPELNIYLLLEFVGYVSSLCDSVRHQLPEC